MRVPLILGLGLMLAVSASFAQRQQTYRVKHSADEAKKPARVAPLPKASNASATTAKDLRRIEMEAAKTNPSSKTLGPKRSKSAAAFKLEKSKPVPPINASTPGGMGVNTKGMGMTNQGKNPYHGRLRQKGSHQ